MMMRLLALSTAVVSLASGVKLEYVFEGDEARVPALALREALAVPGNRRVALPLRDGTVAAFELEHDAALVSPELAARFSNIAAYRGTAVEGGLTVSATYSPAHGLRLQYWAGSVPQGATSSRVENKQVVISFSETTAVQTATTAAASFAAPVALGEAKSNVAALQEECEPFLVATLADGVCDPLANTAACAFDGGDCCNPAAGCRATDSEECTCEAPRNEVLARTLSVAMGVGSDLAADEDKAMELAMSTLQRENQRFEREVGVTLTLEKLSLETVAADGAFLLEEALAGMDLSGVDLGHVLTARTPASGHGRACGAAKLEGWSDPNAPLQTTGALAQQLGAHLNMEACGVYGVGGATRFLTPSDCFAAESEGLTVFHVAALEQMHAHLSHPRLADGACGNVTASISLPAVSANLDFDPCEDDKVRECKVPLLTAFRLAAPQEEAGMAYTWEQVDGAAAVAPGAPLTSAARVVPSLGKLRSGIGALLDTAERLPQEPGVMRFALTAHPTLGLGAAFSGAAVTVEAVQALPLVLVEVDAVVVRGAALNLTWAGGLQNDTFRVLLSTDDGASFPVVLADGLSNTMPKAVASADVPAGLACGAGVARIMLESSNGVEGCSYLVVSQSLEVEGCKPTAVEPVVAVNTSLPLAGPEQMPTVEDLGTQVVSSDGEVSSTGAFAGRKMWLLTAEAKTVRFEIDATDLAPFQTLYVYDGASATAANMLASFTKTFSGSDVSFESTQESMLVVLVSYRVPESGFDGGFRASAVIGISPVTASPTSSTGTTAPTASPTPAVTESPTPSTGTAAPTASPTPAVTESPTPSTETTAPTASPTPASSNEITFVDYANDSDQSWLLEAPAGSVVSLEILELETELNNDFVTFYDGATRSDGLIYQMSGTGFNGAVIQSSGQQMLVRFQSDSEISARGLRAAYTFVDDFVLQGSGSFASNEPPAYDKTIFIKSWMLEVPQGEVVSLAFDTFELDAVDSVTVYDSVGPAASAVAVLSGSQRPQTVLSVGNQMRVEMRKISDNSMPGFTASFEGVPNPYLLGPDPATFSDDPSTIDDPDRQYASLASKTWTIEMAPEVEAVELTFERLGLGAGDTITVLDGTGDSATALRTFTAGESDGAVVRGLSSGMTVVMTTDSEEEGFGFIASFAAATTPVFLGADVTRISDDDTTIGDDNRQYEPLLYKAWVVSVASLKLCRVDFDRLELGPGDFVAVYEGSGVRGTPIRTLENTATGTAVQGAGNMLTVVFSSDAVGSGFGFTANISEGRSPYLLGPEPGFFADTVNMYGVEDREYANDLDTTYYIEMNPDEIAQVTFERFSTEADYDFVTVTDGATREELFRKSGEQSGAVVRGSSNLLEVRFQSDSGVTAFGFDARYSGVKVAPPVQLSPEGGVFADINGTYGETDRTEFAPGEIKIWNIETEVSQAATLTITNILGDPAPDANSQQGFLRVFDAGSAEVELFSTVDVGVLSGGVFKSSTNKMRIVFSPGDAKIGFEASYGPESMIRGPETPGTIVGSGALDETYIIGLEQDLGKVVGVTLVSKAGGEVVLHDGFNLAAPSTTLVVGEKATTSAGVGAVRAIGGAAFELLYEAASSPFALGPDAGVFADDMSTINNTDRTYSNNLDLTWTITMRPGERAFIEFDTCETEPNYDFLTVTDAVTGDELEKFSGPCSGKRFTSAEGSNALRVNLASDGSVTAFGFIASYGPATGSRGDVVVLDVTEGSPVVVPSAALVKLRAPAGKRVSLAYSELDLDGEAQLLILDGPTQDSDVLRVFSAAMDVVPFPVVSTGGDLFLKLEGSVNAVAMASVVGDSCSEGGGDDDDDDDDDDEDEAGVSLGVIIGASVGGLAALLALGFLLRSSCAAKPDTSDDLDVIAVEKAELASENPQYTSAV